MRVALVHDWLTGMRGGEQCLEALLELFPDSEIFTLLHVPGAVSRAIESRPIHTSFVNRLPGAARHYRYYLPFFPLAIEQFGLQRFDLVISVSHCVAKSARAPRGVPHLCYCLTPMRYVWDQYSAYFGPGRASRAVRGAAAVVTPLLRQWDLATANRVHRYVACSHHVRGRIERAYGREAGVVYPPVKWRHVASNITREDFYLIVGALVPYKRMDIAVEACNRLRRPLVIVGDGSEYGRLERLAGPTVSLTGHVADDVVAQLMSRCRAFLFPGEEDFGIVLVEAQAAGAPVIAYGVGGATETVVGANGRARPGCAPTGLFFHEQTADALIEAILRFERMTFDPAASRASTAPFTGDAFKAGIRSEVDVLLSV